MARLARLAVAGGLHHVALRGHNGAALFTDDEDRRSFLEALRHAAREHRVAVHAYALLVSQAQWLATPAEGPALGRVMQTLGRRYVGGFNRRHGRTGSLWDGRFHSSVLDAASWLFPAIVYIETLPVIQGLASEPTQWPWSSAAGHVGTVRDPLLTDHPEYWCFGNTPFERERTHADMIAVLPEAQQRTQLEAALRRGSALGPPAFLEHLGRRTGRSLLHRPRGRPPKMVSPFKV
jgi:putative transposase